MNLVPEGYRLVPIQPSEKQWSGIARAIIMAWEFNQKTPRQLFKHLNNSGYKIPQWMIDEPEMKTPDHVPSKGTRAALIYRVMVEDALPPEATSDAEPMFYLQDSRSYVGNCPMWWALGGNGYTTRLDRAQRYTLKEAMTRYKCRDTDIPWPCQQIDAILRPTVDMQDMDNIEAHMSAMLEIQSMSARKAKS